MRETETERGKQREEVELGRETDALRETDRNRL